MAGDPLEGEEVEGEVWEEGEALVGWLAVLDMELPSCCMLAIRCCMKRFCCILL